MNQETSNGKAGRLLPAAPGSAENVCLPNDTKIRFCNAFDAIKAHCILCKECDMYLRWGDGDLCSAGKTIIAMELCFTDTSIEFPPNDQAQRPPPEMPGRLQQSLTNYLNRAAAQRGGGSLQRPG